MGYGEEKRFPLIVWESTQEAEDSYKKAQERFRELYERLKSDKERDFTCTMLGSLRFSEDLEPEVWLNDNRPLLAYRWLANSNNPAQEAMRLALRYGRCGWWSLDELEKFVNGHGPMVDRAMIDYKFRRGTKDKTKWVRVRGRKEEDEIRERSMREYKEVEKKKEEAELPGNEEREKLEKIIVMPQSNLILDQTFEVAVNSKGFVYIAFRINPFGGTTAESMPYHFAQARRRGHLAKQQEGFKIEARNVRLGYDQSKGVKGSARMVYIKATRDDGSLIEVVWPTYVPDNRLVSLAGDLVSRVKGERVQLSGPAGAASCIGEEEEFY